MPPNRAAGKTSGKKAAKAKPQPVGPIGRKEVAGAERRAAAAKSPAAKKITRAVADRLRDVHSGNAARRTARRVGPSQAQARANSQSSGRRKGSK